MQVIASRLIERVAGSRLALARQDKEATRVDVIGEAAFERELLQEVAKDQWSASTEVREADRSHVSGPPSSSEHMDVRTARPDEEYPY